MKNEIRVIWILDASSSMNAKGKINSVNMLVREAIPLIKDLSSEYPAYSFSMRALTFSSGSSWIDDHFQNIEGYSWEDLTAEGKSDLGAAFKKIEEMLIEDSQEENPSFSYVFVLITDGFPTDEWISSLDDITKNKLFFNALKTAITIQDTDRQQTVLKKFIGENVSLEEFVFSVDDLERIPMAIRSIIAD